MKILLNPIISNHKSYAKKQLEKSYNNNNENTKNIELSDYKHFQFNISFGNKKFVSTTNLKLVKDLENLRLEKKFLLKEVVEDSVVDAKNKLQKYKDWYDYTSARYSEKIKAEAERYARRAGEEAQKKYHEAHGKVYRFFCGDGSDEYQTAYDQEMYSRFYTELDVIHNIGSNKNLYEAIVNGSNQNEKQKECRIQEIDKSIQVIQKLINYQGLQDSVNQMLASHGGINDRIAGYEKEKAEIKSKFIDLLAKSKEDESIEVPAAVILYGPTGTGKTTFTLGVQEQSKDYATVIKVPTASPQSVMRLIREYMEIAKKRYTEENKRTILLMDDVEKYFAIKEQDAKILGIDLDDMDKSMLEAYGNNYGMISDFKQLLDTISKVPNEEDIGGTRAATSIFITTNYPHLIHPDILSREGKATKIAIGLASNENLAKVMKHHFKNLESVAETFRSLKGNPEGENFLDSVSGITEKGRDVLKQMLIDGTIDQIKVDYMNMPYNKLTQGLGPDTKKGAFSNDKIHKMSKDAFYDYLEQANDGGDFRDSFFKIFCNTKRDISPERLKKFNLIDRMIKDAPIDIETLESLLYQRDMGMLSPKKENLLSYHLNKIKTELNSLREYEIAEGLNEEQKARKFELESLENKINGTADNYTKNSSNDFE